ncbi:MAG TPA: M23 family metallopeptidase [Ornithinibacter sp.]|nr:M23 family metallopeptidase [Ornithinibacter sp.]
MTPPAPLPRLAVALAGSLGVVGAGLLGGTEVPTWGGSAALARSPAALVATPVTQEALRTGAGRGTLGLGVATDGSRVPRAGPDRPAPASPWPRSGTRWRWPLEPRPAVVQPFRAPRSAWGAGHRGLDLATRAGASVLAVEAGRVTHAGVVAGRGTVSVQHRDGLVSTYEPVRPGVAVGEDVAAGHAVGVVEPGVAGHCGSIGCLHLGARRGSVYLDPWPLLAGGALALLPLR